jgi:hypothetical protein
MIFAPIRSRQHRHPRLFCSSVSSFLQDSDSVKIITQFMSKVASCVCGRRSPVPNRRSQQSWAISTVAKGLGRCLVERETRCQPKEEKKGWERAKVGAGRARIERGRGKGVGGGSGGVCEDSRFRRHPPGVRECVGEIERERDWIGPHRGVSARAPGSRSARYHAKAASTLTKYRGFGGAE